VHYFEITDSVKEDSGRYTAEAVNSKGSVCSSADVRYSVFLFLVISQSVC